MELHDGLCHAVDTSFKDLCVTQCAQSLFTEEVLLFFK